MNCNACTQPDENGSGATGPALRRMVSRRGVLRVLVPMVVIAGVAATLGLRSTPTFTAPIQNALEDRLPDGALYTAGTQSLVRGHHLFEQFNRVAVNVAREDVATLTLASESGDQQVVIRHLPLDQLVPRLHYRAASPPDAFDKYNLMLAEYARNSLSVPVGARGDRMAHFETDLDESVPWRLEGDFGFRANRDVRPVRVSVINNCLDPGLWELSATDRAGEIYHGWFPMPLDLYIPIVARTNGVPEDFAGEATSWKMSRDETVPLALDRLRRVDAFYGTVSAQRLADGLIGYSSQDSRRKIDRQFVQVAAGAEQWTAPRSRDDLVVGACRFSEFVNPGKYSSDKRKRYDLAFLATPSDASVRRVTPRTDYDWNRTDGEQQSDREAAPCVEVELHLADHVLLLGNLPMDLLVPQEDLVISGFGVGVLASGGLAERRRYLIDDGPPPSYAYLCKSNAERLEGINSHEFGVEQVFIRTHIDDAEPWWEITITSYERIVDLVKYRVAIPDSLHAELRRGASTYVSPLYRTYRDDNLR